MSRLTTAALLSIVALVLLLATPHALLASIAALCALLLTPRPKNYTGDTDDPPIQPRESPLQARR